MMVELFYSRMATSSEFGEISNDVILYAKWIRAKSGSSASGSFNTSVLL